MEWWIQDRVSTVQLEFNMYHVFFVGVTLAIYMILYDSILAKYWKLSVIHVEHIYSKKIGYLL